MWGRLTWGAFQHDMIEVGAGIMMLVAALVAVGLLFYFKRWKWLWDEWLTSLDPKRIGVMYIAVAAVMLFKGLADGVMMRAQQMLSVGDSHGYLTSSHFQQIFTAHGTTMIFFVGMGIVFGLMNLVVPLQIGARDVAFPFLNGVSFWLFAMSSVLLNLSLVIGNFSGAGWLAYPPLSGLEYNPGVGVDYWIWTLQIAGVGSLLAGINFIVTIFKMRCPGMTFMKMPIFIWSILGCLILIIFAFPVLTATLGMLSLDRYLGMHFFTPEAGGSPMMFVNLIWAWGHPEVYILILPAFGVFSEVVATFSQKRLFGYVSMVWALIAIVFLSFIVWLHHFFTMGAGPKVNAFFGIMTMLIAIPTGVKVFNWLFTMVRGRVHLTSPMIWFLGFVFLFTVGGMTGVLMSVPPADFQVHNSLFLIAHFHAMILPGVVFGFFAGFTYWFPKFTGFKLNEVLGKWACACWIVGFLFAFMPLFLLGLMGATRRLDHYEAATGWQPLFIIAAVGAAILTIGMVVQIAQILVSIKNRKKNLDLTGDPWNGRTLEWSVKSPPPIYNFAHTPHVHGRDPFWEQKHHKVRKQPYEAIHLPKNSPIGLIIGVCSLLLGFALTWYMWWLAVVSLVAIMACTVVRLWGEDEEVEFSAAKVKKIEGRNN
jgi:cytochrome o ubiquinol oxidase subunit I